MSFLITSVTGNRIFILGSHMEHVKFTCEKNIIAGLQTGHTGCVCSTSLLRYIFGVSLSRPVLPQFTQQRAPGQDSNPGLLQRGQSLCTWDSHSTNWANGGTAFPFFFRFSCHALICLAECLQTSRSLSKSPVVGFKTLYRLSSTYYCTSSLT